MARIDDMIEESEHPCLGAEFGRRYVDPSTATNARQAGEYIASNEAFRQRQDDPKKIDRRTVMLLEKPEGTGCKKMTDKGKLENLIERAEELIERYVDASDPDFCAWKDQTERFLARHFGKDSMELKKFNEFDFSLCCFSTQTPRSRWNDACVKDLNRVKAILKGYLEEMDEEVVVAQERLPNVNMRNVFIVHGHDAALKLSVARLMEKVGIEPIILSEQPNCGSTIIEKIEKYSDVGAAICLFTADDECKDDTKRARQNVVLETGYFWGKLGRDKMVILADKGVELPSDMQGVVYTDTTNWEFSVCKELKQMGYDIDLNCLM